MARTLSWTLLSSTSKAWDIRYSMTWTPLFDMLKLLDARYESRAPILLCLLAMGGRAHISRVLECVKKRMKDKLFYHYYEVLPDGRERWDNEARFARTDLVDEGLITGPRSIWELTEKEERVARSW